MENHFDVVVPTYNRYSELDRFFKNNKVLNSSAVDLWVIDDASESYHPEVLPDWPNLVHIRMPVNKGQAAVRNYVLKKGRAPFIVSLDDDAWFENIPHVLDTIAEMFHANPGAGCIMFNVRTPDSLYSTVSTGEEMAWHITCGCAYRRSALVEIGGFSGFLHSQAEETDVSFRLFRQGWKIIFANEIRVFHDFTPNKRTIEWYLKARFNTTRNDLLIVWMYFPLILVGPFLTGKFLSHIVFAVRNKIAIFSTLWYTLKAMFSMILLTPDAIRRRQPLTWRQFWDFRSLLNKNLK